MSCIDLPDYTRLIAVNVTLPDSVIGTMKVGQYISVPTDLPDGTKTMLLTDIKGRLIVVQYEKDRTITDGKIRYRPQGGVLEKGSVTTAVAYATVASHTVISGKRFQLSKIVVSASKAAWVKYRWNAIDISAERNPDDKTILIEHFPYDYYTMLGDGVKAFDVQAKYDAEAGIVNVEIVGEET